ncbi:hypothetical protein FGB62_187g05 [Gracilaria domingensis]|nr:hypothetical protein FGB62_187g05 [Gracilaria domingensis]
MIDSESVSAANNAANAGNSFAAQWKGAAASGFGHHSTSDENGSDFEDDRDGARAVVLEDRAGGGARRVQRGRLCGDVMKSLEKKVTARSCNVLHEGNGSK